ncbi:MAG: AAA family ATPase [Phycisphaerales bacterium]|nr:AAA family ATPase [Phycisphaerales bacterium]
MAKKTTKKAAKKAPSRRKDAGALLADTPPEAGPVAPRPIPLDEVLGQPRPIGILDAAVASGRLHHAWVFHGPDGVGKFTTALAFAAVILDPESRPDLAGRRRPDPESRVQRMLRAGAHPDLHILRKELAAVSRKEQVRNSKQTTLAKEVVEEFLIEPAARTRVLAGDSLAGKVFLVDEAHLLGKEAQNALLKTLEEPPAGTVLVLVTSSEEQLAPTIRSRCQRVPFGPLDDASMQAWMRRAGFDFGGIDAAWAMGFAGGSPGVLRAIVESGLGAWHAEVQPALDRLLAGEPVIELGAQLAKLVDEAAAAAVAGDARASKEVANRVAAKRMFRLLGESFRRQMRRAAAVGRLDDAERAAECIAMVEDAERQLESNVALAMIFENLAAQCAVV